MKRLRLVGWALVGAFVLGIGGAIAAEVKLKSITALPRKHPLNEPLDHFTKLVHKYSNNQIAIQYIGAGDTIPVPEQMKGLTRGVVDVFYGPMSYYQGSIPEVQALNGSNKHAMNVRTSGGLSLLNKFVNERLKGELIGYYASGYTFYIYTKKKPKIGSDGLPDLTGLKLRAAPIYREMFAQFGASTVLVHVAEIFTALERGVVDGIGWIGPFVTNLGWDKFLKYRITPAYWQGDIVLVVNKSKWDGLDLASQRAMTRAAIETEFYAHDLFAGYSAEERKKLAERGMVNVDLKDEAAKRYLSVAYDIGVWKGMAKNGVPAEVIEDFKARMYRP